MLETAEDVHTMLFSIYLFRNGLSVLNRSERRGIKGETA